MVTGILFVLFILHNPRAPTPFHHSNHQRFLVICKLMVVGVCKYVFSVCMTPPSYFWTTYFPSWILASLIFCTSSTVSAAHALSCLFLFIDDYIFSVPTYIPIFLYFLLAFAFLFTTTLKAVYVSFVLTSNLLNCIISSLLYSGYF